MAFAFFFHIPPLYQSANQNFPAGEKKKRKKKEKKSDWHKKTWTHPPRAAFSNSTNGHTVVQSLQPDTWGHL